MYRRQCLASLGGVSLLGLAGCASIDGSGGEASSVAPPRVPERRLRREGWRQAANPPAEQVYRQAIGQLGIVSATQNTVVYEDAALSERLRADTMGEFPEDGDALRVFFATRVEIDAPGDVDAWPVVEEDVFERVRATARGQFAAELRANGVTELRETDHGTIAIDTGEEARVTRYAGSYRYDDMTIPVTRKEALTFDGDTVAVEGLLAVWRRDGRILVAGGAYPAEEFHRQLSDELTDAITVAVDIDLGLQPDQYRGELRELVRAVR